MADLTDQLEPIPERDLSWCHETVRDVSRTFALTIDVLDEPMSTQICVGYLMCRIADTIEDTRVIPASEKTFLLDRYDEVLDSDHSFTAKEFEDAIDPFLPEERTDEWTVVANTSRVIRTVDRLPDDVRAALVLPTRELVEGMAMFVDRHADRGGIRIQNPAELEEYCYYVAGTVGHLITNLIVRDVEDEDIDESLRGTAEEFGLLLQLVNVAKDVHADYTQENNVYLPRNWFHQADASQEDPLASETTQDVASIVERTADRAQSYLDDAHSYLDTLGQVDRNMFVAWAIPFLLAVGTLRELAARPEDALSQGGVKISRDEVTAIVAAVTDSRDPRALATLRESVRRGVLG
jgi:farnesyl-diphosphate farnesyltransferase